MHKRSVIFALPVCLAIGISRLGAHGQGTLLYSNAESRDPQFPGLVLGNRQMAGMRFQLSSGAIIDGIGGNINVIAGNGDGRIFGALVRLSDINDYPDSVDLSTPDVLTAVAFSAGPFVTDVAVPIGPLTVGPGTYGLVLGSDLFGASGVGSMSGANLDFLSSSTFFYNAFDNVWSPYGPGGGLRFTVYGRPVPELSTVYLALLSTVMLYFRGWQRRKS
jgi:hypothetical protein